MRDSRCLDDADENEESGDNEQNSDHSFNDKMQDQTSKKRKTLNQQDHLFMFLHVQCIYMQKHTLYIHKYLMKLC